MSVEGWLALALGLVLGGVLIPFGMRTVSHVKQARETAQRYQQVASQLQQTQKVLLATLGTVVNDKGEYRITKAAQKKGDTIGDVNWRIEKQGGLVISTIPRDSQ